MSEAMRQLFLQAMYSTEVSEESLLDEDTVWELVNSIRDLKRKFKVACQQLIQINNLIDEVEARHHRAQVNAQPAICQNLTLRLSTLEGVRSLFYTYASKKGEELDTLQLIFRDVTGMPWSSSFEVDINSILNFFELVTPPASEDEDHADSSFRNDSDMELN